MNADVFDAEALELIADGVRAALSSELSLRPCSIRVVREEIEIAYDDADAWRARLSAGLGNVGWLWRFGAGPIASPALQAQDIEGVPLAAEFATGSKESVAVRHLHGQRWSVVALREYAVGDPDAPRDALPALAQEVETLMAGGDFRLVHTRYWTFEDGPPRALYARLHHAVNETP